jgi:hypothetical protein
MVAILTLSRNTHKVFYDKQNISKTVVSTESKISHKILNINLTWELGIPSIAQALPSNMEKSFSQAQLPSEKPKKQPKPKMQPKTQTKK